MPANRRVVGNDPKAFTKGILGLLAVWALWFVMALGVAIFINLAWAYAVVLFAPSIATHVSAALSCGIVAIALSAATVRVVQEALPAIAVGRQVALGFAAGCCALLLLAILPYYHPPDVRGPMASWALVVVPLESLFCAGLMSAGRLLQSAGTLLRAPSSPTAGGTAASQPDAPAALAAPGAPSDAPPAPAAPEAPPGDATPLDLREAIRDRAVLALLAASAVLGLFVRTRVGALLLLLLGPGALMGLYHERRVNAAAAPVRAMGAAATLTLVTAFVPPIFSSLFAIAIYQAVLVVLYLFVFARLRRARPLSWSGLPLSAALAALAQLCLIPLPGWIGGPLGVVLCVGVIAAATRIPTASPVPLQIGALPWRVGLAACGVVWLAFTWLLIRNVAPPRWALLQAASQRYSGDLDLSHGPWFLDADGFFALAVERQTNNVNASGDLVRLDPARAALHEGWPLDPSPSWHVSGYARSASGDVALVFANSFENRVYLAQRDGGAKFLGSLPRPPYTDLIAVDWNGEELELVSASEHLPYRPSDIEIASLSRTGSVRRRTIPQPRPASERACTVEAASRTGDAWKFLVSAATVDDAPRTPLQLFVMTEGGQPREIAGAAVEHDVWKRGQAISRACGNVIQDYGFACLYDPVTDSVTPASASGSLVTANFRVGGAHLEPLLCTGRAFQVGSDWITVANVDGALHLQRGGQTGPVLSREKALIETGRLVPADTRSAWLMAENGQFMKIDLLTLQRVDTQNWLRRILDWWNTAPLPATVLLLLLSPVLAWLRAPAGEERAVTLAVIGIATTLVALETLLLLAWSPGL